MWLFFALLSAFFFATTIIIDKYCVEEIFEAPWFGMVIGSITSMMIFIFLPYIAPFIEWTFPGWKIIAYGLAAGFLIQFSILFYFKSLSYSEAGIVSAYWNMVPVMVVGLSFVFMNEILSTKNYIGITVLILASVSLCLLDSKIQTRWQAFGLMVIASFMQAVMLLLEKIVYTNTSYVIGFYVITTGLIIAGLTPLLIKKFRVQITKQRKRLLKSGKMFFGVEAMNLLALALSQAAIFLGIPSLVAAVESTIPAYVILCSAILFLVFKVKQESSALEKLPQKLGLITVMVIGISMLT